MKDMLNVMLSRMTHVQMKVMINYMQDVILDVIMKDMTDTS